MAARMTIERILRDPDDDTAQTVRDWKIEAEDTGHIVVRLKHGSGFLMLRAGDIEQFIADLERAREAAIDLSTERAHA